MGKIFFYAPLKIMLTPRWLKLDLNVGIDFKLQQNKIIDDKIGKIEKFCDVVNHTKRHRFRALREISIFQKRAHKI